MGGSLGIDGKRRGSHQWELSLQDHLHTMDVCIFASPVTCTRWAYHFQLENIFSMVYYIGIMFSKLVILFLFVKVFVPVHRGLIYWVNAILIWTNATFYLAGLVGLIF